MPEASKSYANWEILQDADSDITVEFNTGHAIDDYEYKARIVKDFDGTTFAFGDAGSIDFIEIDQTSRSSAPSVNGVKNYGAITFAPDPVTASDTPVMTIKLFASQTKDFPDSFEGYWDLLELIPSTGAYTRQAQGEIFVGNSATAQEGW